MIRDGGIDTANLGKGDWIYIVPDAIAQMNGHVPAVTNMMSMMIFLKNQGMRYIIVKAGTDATLYAPYGSVQFTPAVINAAHAAGLWVFGYNYTTGQNIAGDIAVANYVFTNGADGFVYDAEIEWEAQNLPNNTTLATQLASTVRSNWPNKFIALSTWGYRGVHTSFPYKEFAYYCDSIMPQDYWIEFGDTATQSVSTMNSQWRTWQNGLSGIWTNAIKPFAPTGQGWSSASGTITAAQITEFFNALKTVANPVTAGGYQGINFWRAELHPMDVWDAIRTNTIGTVPTSAPVVTNVTVSGITASSATFTWTTDQSSDSVVEYGPTTSYGSSVTNTSPIYYHTVNVSGLAADTTYHYRVKSKNSSNNQGVSADYVLTTPAVSVSDIIIDQDNANNTGGNTITYNGSWVGTTAGAAYLGTFRYANPSYTALGSPTSTARFIPNIVTAGNYNVYASWSASATGGNRATNAPFRINNGGVITTTRVNEEANGNTFRLIGSSKFFQAGTTDYVEAGNDVTTGVGGDIVIADAVKLVYIPPPPSAPSIATQPASQTVNQGNTATFIVNASGTATLTYQWKHAGTNLPGATTSSYVKNNVQPADAGNYFVGITNEIGFSNSATAVLTVNLYPAITAQPQSTNANIGDDVTFTVTASGTPPLAYQWRFNAANISGATASSYTKNNIQTTNAGNYSVMVSNVAGTATSDDAVLTVIQPEPPHIDLISVLADGRAWLQISGSPGHYAVDAATDLSTNASDWLELANFFTTTNIFEYTDPQTNLPRRFYRARGLSP